jgi:hypothetical protein
MEEVYTSFVHVQYKIEFCTRMMISWTNHNESNIQLLTITGLSSAVHVIADRQLQQIRDVTD